MPEEQLDLDGAPLEKVLQIRQKAWDLLGEGKTIMQWGEGGTSAQKQLVAPISNVLAACKRQLQRLGYTDGLGRRVTKTVASFSGNF